MDLPCQLEACNHIGSFMGLLLLQQFYSSTLHIELVVEDHTSLPRIPTVSLDSSDVHKQLN